MRSQEERIAEVLAVHNNGIVANHVHKQLRWECVCGETVHEGHIAGADSGLDSHLTSTLARLFAEDYEAEALKAEATNLRELHTLIEGTPWNPMPPEDKDRCVKFLSETGLDDDEYTDRHMNNYADWLDHRAEQIRSKR